jgi:DNA-binding SARP family transcriptional activator
VSDLPLKISLPARASGGAGPRLTSVSRLGSPPLTLRLLGPFSARRGGHLLDPGPLGSRNGSRLVRFLLAHRDRGVSQDEILGRLWPQASRDAAKVYLRQAVADARQMLDEPGRSGSALCTADGSYRLCLDWHARVDADYFEAIASMALRTHGANRRAQLELALSQWTGSPMPEERHSPWADEWRGRLCDRHAELLRARAALPLRRPAQADPRRGVTPSRQRTSPAAS